MNFNKKSTVAAVKRILKSGEKISRPGFDKPWINDSGAYCVCDGFRLIEIGSEYAPADEIAPQKENPFIAGDKLFMPFDSGAKIYNAVAPVDLAELKAAGIGWKPGMFPFLLRPDMDGVPVPGVNPRYLLDVLRIFPDAVIYTAGKSDPVIFISEYGRGLLCPVRYKDPAPEEKPAAPVQEDPAPAPVEEQPAEAPAELEKPARPVPEKTFIGTEITGDGWKILFDAAANRTRVIVAGDPARKTVETIEAAGFYYSPVMKSWNKKLTFKAYRAALALAETLRAA